MNTFTPFVGGQDAALDHLSDNAGQGDARLSGIADSFEAGDGIQALLGEHQGALHIVDPQDDQVQLVPNPTKSSVLAEGSSVNSARGT